MINEHAQVALGMPGFPLWLYHLAECFCHLGLAASVFLTIAITIERYQVRMMMMMIGRCSDKLKILCRYVICHNLQKIIPFSGNLLLSAFVPITFDIHRFLYKNVCFYFGILYRLYEAYFLGAFAIVLK